MSKKTKTFLTLKTKCEILEKVEKGCNLKHLADQYGVTKSTISRIKNSKEKLLRVSSMCNKKRKSAKKGEFERMEKLLYKWFLEQRANHVPISGNLIKEKAKSLHRKIYGVNSSFNASCGWLNGFKARFGIRLLKICGEKLSSDQIAVPDFKANILQLKKELNLNDNQIYNADETGLFWKMLPEKTYVSSEEKNAPGRKAEKARITVLMCTNATGLHKLQPLVIGQAKNPRSFKNFQLPVEYRHAKRAWMNSDIFKEWFHKSFIPQVTTFLKQQNLPVKAVLILDNAPCHPGADLLRSENGSIFVMYMPPNVTPLLQPMDQNVIRITKLQYRTNLLRSAINKKNIAEFLKNLSLRDCVCLLIQAWQSLECNMIQKCWEPLMRENNGDRINDSEDDMPLSEIRKEMLAQKQPVLEELQNLITLVLPEVKSDNHVISMLLYTHCYYFQINFNSEDVEKWTTVDENIDHTLLDKNEGMLNDDDDEDDVEVIEEELAQKSKITSSEAVLTFDKAIEWAEQNTTSLENIIILKNFRNIALTKSMEAKKTQSKIHEFFKK